MSSEIDVAFLRLNSIIFRINKGRNNCIYGNYFIFNNKMDHIRKLFDRQAANFVVSYSKEWIAF